MKKIFSVIKDKCVRYAESHPSLMAVTLGLVITLAVGTASGIVAPHDAFAVVNSGGIKN